MYEKIAHDANISSNSFPFNCIQFHYLVFPPKKIGKLESDISITPLFWLGNTAKYSSKYYGAKCSIWIIRFYYYWKSQIFGYVYAWTEKAKGEGKKNIYIYRGYPLYTWYTFWWIILVIQIVCWKYFFHE